MTDNGARTQAWLDGLDDEDHAEATRVMAMPPPMAAAYAQWDAKQGRRRIYERIDGQPNKRSLVVAAAFGGGLVDGVARLAELLL